MTTTTATTTPKLAPRGHQAPNPKLAGPANTLFARLRRRVRNIQLRPSRPSRPTSPKRFTSLRKMLRPGESISAGNLVLSNNDGALVVRLGADLAFIVTHQYFGLEFEVRAYNQSPRVISMARTDQLTSERPVPEPAPAEPPLCMFGPGGSYTRPWPPTCPQGANEASDSENVDTLV